MTEEDKALEKYGHFNSTHEVYGVLLEEVNEFWDIVKEPGIRNDYLCQTSVPEFMELKDKKERMILELNQIRSIAQRAIKELEDDKIKWV